MHRGSKIGASYDACESGPQACAGLIGNAIMEADLEEISNNFGTRYRLLVI